MIANFSITIHGQVVLLFTLIPQCYCLKSLGEKKPCINLSLYHVGICTKNWFKFWAQWAYPYYVFILVTKKWWAALLGIISFMTYTHIIHEMGDGLKIMLSSYRENERRYEGVWERVRFRIFCSMSSFNKVFKPHCFWLLLFLLIVFSDLPAWKIIWWQAMIIIEASELVGTD